MAATRGLAAFNRMITNLYNAVFEQPVRKFNRQFRYAITVENVGGAPVTTGPFYYETPVARYYEDLTRASAGNPGTGIEYTYSAAVCGEDQMWAVYAIKPTWAYTAPPTTPILWDWRDDANNRLTIDYNTGTNAWRVSRLSAGAGASVEVAGSHAANDLVILVVRWTSTTLYVSLNGGSWQSQANSSIPTITNTSMILSHATSPPNSAYGWVAIGVGVLTDADRDAYNTLGWHDTEDLYWPDIPSILLSAVSFLWSRPNTNGIVHVPTATYGESLYE